MKKTLFFAMAAIALALLIAPSVAYAEPPKPEPFFWGMVGCSGYDVSDLVVLRAKFDAWYGAQYRVTDWVGNYHARMNEFARSLGCHPPFNAEGQLTLSYRIVAEWQARVYHWYVDPN